MRFAAAFAALVLVAASPARSETPDRCDGYGDLKVRPALAMARIVGAAKRVPFVRNAEGANRCPDATAACRDKAYLVPGDAVIASAVRMGFTCVDYVDAKGDDRAGWIPSASVERQPAPTVGGADWIGTWKRTEATVTIERAGPEGLAFKGDATFGALDPDRVKRGSVNIGQFEAKGTATGPDFAFDAGGKGTLPVDKGDDGDCKVWLRRLGPYLLVDDNDACGGFNVTFRGIYQRKR